MESPNSPSRDSARATLTRMPSSSTDRPPRESFIVARMSSAPAERSRDSSFPTLARAPSAPADGFNSFMKSKGGQNGSSSSTVSLPAQKLLKAGPETARLAHELLDATVLPRMKEVGVTK